MKTVKVGGVDLPAADFTSADLVQCTVQLNSGYLYDFLQALLRATSGFAGQFEQMRTEVQTVRDETKAAREELAKELAEARQALTDEVAASEQRARAHAETVRSELSEALQRQLGQVERVERGLAQHTDDISELRGDIATLRREREQMLGTIRAEIGAVRVSIEEGYMKECDAVRGEVGAVREEVRKVADEVTVAKRLYDLLELDRGAVADTVRDGATEEKVALLHACPALKGLKEGVESAAERAERDAAENAAKFASVTEELKKKVDDTEFQELKRESSFDGLNKQLREVRGECEKLRRGQDTVKKHVAVVEDRKLDKHELGALHGLLAELERRMAEAGGGEDGRFDLLSDKVVEFEQLLAKLDRRKVNRSEMQRSIKGLRRRLDGEDPRAATSPGSPGGVYMSGDRAAFVRYKCLSCQSPAAKAEDARLSPMPQSFPPGSILTSPTTQAQQSSRQQRKLDNYFEWVTHTGQTPSPSARQTSPPRPQPPPAGPPVPDESDPGGSSHATTPGGTVRKRKVRTRLLGTDHKIYQGAGELHVVERPAVEVPTASGDAGAAADATPAPAPADAPPPDAAPQPLPPPPLPPDDGGGAGGGGDGGRGEVEGAAAGTAGAEA